MGNGTDVAGVVGTWVAVFLGATALIGIVGPLLVWQASRTDRQKALDTMGEDTGGFVTKGIAFRGDIRLFRRIEAPILTSEPSVAELTLAWNPKAQLASQGSTSWVKLGLVLRAYQFDYQCGNSILIEDKRTLLPVNRVWIMLIGIIGGFGQRPDRGKLVTRSVVTSTQAVPGSRAFRRSRGLRDLDRPGWQTASQGWGAFTDTSTFSDGAYGTLYGLVGTLHMPTGKSGLSRDSTHYPIQTNYASFTHHTPAEIGELRPHPLPLRSLFWLAVGCLPAINGIVYSLEDVSIIPYEGMLVKPSQTSPGYSYSPAIGVHFADDDADHTLPPTRLASNTYAYTPSALPGGPYPKNRDISAVRGFQLSITTERTEALSHIATAVGAEVADVFSLREMELDQATTSELDRYAGMTYVPAESGWVRMVNDMSREPGYAGVWFLRRVDAQLLARVLLELELHAQGYLFGGHRRSRCLQTLSNAAEALPQLLGRLLQHISSLGLQVDEEEKLLVAMEQMMVLVSRKIERGSRVMSAAIFELDQVLLSLGHPDSKVNIIIGVLMITNAEFRSMIAQSARHLDVSAKSSTDLDFETASLNIQAVFGIMQPFPLDFNEIFPGMDIGHNRISVQYSVIILAALRASLRSAFLVVSLDSLPLFELVMSSDDVVHFD